MPSPARLLYSCQVFFSAILVVLGLLRIAVAQQPSAEDSIVLHAQPAESQSRLAPVTMNGERRVVPTDGHVTLEQDRSISGLGPLSTHNVPAATSSAVIIQLPHPPLLAAAQRKSSGMASAARASASAAAEIESEHLQARSLITQSLSAKSAQASAAHSQSPRITREYSTAFNGFAVRGLSIQEARKTFAGMPGVAVFEDVAVQASLSESVAAIRATEVWQRPNGLGLDGSGTTIGIVDTGVDYTHPDLGGCLGASCKVIGGYDFVNNDADPMDDHGHGTHVAATAAGNGSYLDSNGVSQPLPGVAPGARIVGYKVLSAGGWGSSADIIAAIERCADPNLDGNFSDHLDVCSLSLGGFGDPNDPMSQAIDLASANGVVFTVAAGNSGPAANTIGSPGTAREAITVAAACKPGVPSSACGSSPMASFSSRGPIAGFPDVAKPDVAAPGVGICAARFGSYASGQECKDSRHIAISGTSMATPHVAGLAALIRQGNPSLSPAQVKAIIVGTASDLGVDATVQGSGMVDAVAAVDAAGQPYEFLRFQGGAPVIRYTPSRLVQEHAANITVVNTSGAALSVSPQPPAAIPGITVLFPDGDVTLQVGETRSIPTLISVDHRVKVSQRVMVPLVFSTPLGNASLSALLEIGSPLSLSSATLNFGLSLPEDIGFAAAQQITLTNSITDASWNYTLSGGAWAGERGSPSRFSTALSAPSVSVPAAGSTTVTVTVSAGGSAGSNGLNTSALSVSGGNVSASVPLSVWQGYPLRISYGSTTPWYVTLGSRSPRAGSSYGERLSFDPAAGTSSTTIYVRTSGDWDVASLFAGNGGADALVLKTIPVSGLQSSVETAEQDATVSHISRIPQSSGVLFYSWTISPKLGGRELSVSPLLIDFRGGSDVTLLTNPISSEWTLSAFAGIAPFVDDDVMQPISVMHFRREGPLNSSADMNPGALRPYLINATSHANPNAQTQITLLMGTRTLSRTGSIQSEWTVINSLRAEAGEVPFILAGGFHDNEPGATSGADLPYASFLLGSYQAPELQGPTLTFSQSSALSYDDSRFKVHWSFEDWEIPYSYGPGAFFGPRLRSVNGPGTISLGVGPVVDTSRWYNVGASTGVLVPPTGLLSSYYQYGGNSRARGFITAFGDAFPEAAPEYVISRDGAPVQSGTVRESQVCPPHRPGYCLFPATGIYQLSLPKSSGAVVPGNYSVSLQHDATILGVTTDVTTESSFTVPTAQEHAVAPADENPPSLRDLHVSVGGVWQSGIDPSAANVIDFSLDPNPGLGAPANTPGELNHEQLPDSLQSVRLLESADKASWSEVQLESAPSGRFSGQVSTRQGAALYHFRIEASDAAGNDFAYTFSLPSASARALTSPETLPLSVTLDAIPNGAPYAPDETVRLSVRARNVVSGSKIEAVINGQPLELAAFAPAQRGLQQFVTFLRASELPTGTVTVAARVEDALGRQATSDSQSFTVSTTSNRGDTSLSLTLSPEWKFRVGAKVSFSVKAFGPAAQSLDNVTVMANGKPACRLKQQPYVCSWRVPEAPRLSLRLRARATDQSGNLIRSKLVRVTVRR